MIVGQIQKGEKMGRTLNEDDVLKEIDRWIGYLDEDMITRIKIGIKKLQSVQPEQCEDAVSRRILLSDLKELIAAWKKYPVMAEQIKGVEAAIGYVETIPSVTPKTEQRWIPCSERLPETHKAGNSVSGIFMQSKPVLVYGVPEYESEYSFNVVTYCDDLNGITYWSTEMDAETINEVTAWMPLPEPYREEGETDESD